MIKLDGQQSCPCKLRLLREDEVKFNLSVKQDDIPVRGNVLASGDDALDREAENEAIRRLNQGDIWAWALVTVIAEWNGFSEDELNRRALAESIAYFSSHPELMRNVNDIPTADDLINQRHCAENPDEYDDDNDRGPWDVLEPAPAPVVPPEQLQGKAQPATSLQLQLFAIGDEVMSVDLGRQTSREDLDAIASALRVLIRYYDQRSQDELCSNHHGRSQL